MVDIVHAIRFSKEYVKLHGQTSAELLAVRRIRIDEDTPQEFLDYDTIAVDGSRYELKVGSYVQMVFLGNLGIPFCTIRSDRPAMKGMASKYDWYMSLVGRTFRIERI